MATSRKRLMAFKAERTFGPIGWRSTRERLSVEPLPAERSVRHVLSRMYHLDLVDRTSGWEGRFEYFATPRLHCLLRAAGVSSETFEPARPVVQQSGVCDRFAPDPPSALCGHRQR